MACGMCDKSPCPFGDGKPPRLASARLSVTCMPHPRRRAAIAESPSGASLGSRGPTQSLG